MSKPPRRYQGRRQQRFEARWAQCCLEIGPPPGSDYVPMLGYTTQAGVVYASRWRKRTVQRRCAIQG